MHKRQLNVMFVGGANDRTDFHLDEGSEFFFQFEGRMELPIIEQGKLKNIVIREGEVYLLPSRIPHSPQRPEADSFGLVIERERYPGEWDGLRWYTDFAKCDEILYEKFFYCRNLGKDLGPLVREFKTSPECASGTPGENIHPDPKPILQDVTTAVPAPFNLWTWIEEHASELAQGKALNLFEGHPDQEICVMIVGGESQQQHKYLHEVWLYQLRGDVTFTSEPGHPSQSLAEGCCCIIPPHQEYSVCRPAGSIGMVVTQDPMGNKCPRNTFPRF